MRAGLRVFDADTHISPCAELLEPYLEPLVRQRIPDLDRYKAPIKIGLAGEVRQEPYRHTYRFAESKGWNSDAIRILGEAAPRAGLQRRFQKFQGTRFPTEGGVDDPHIRVADMDAEGVDVQVMVPAAANAHPDPDIEMAFLRAQHRFLEDFCAPYPHRLKSLIVVSGRAIAESVEEIQRWATSSWAVGVQVYLPLDFPIDHPDMDPIWRATQDAGLCVTHHSHSSGYPGYRDLWSNPFLGRSASHPWEAMRMLAAFLGGGIMERFPDLRLAVLESGFGWLPFWARRIDDQMDYMGYVAEGLQHKPSDCILGGRFFTSIVLHEGADMVAMVNHMLGDHILMFGSDYPHSESRFPESVDKVLGWDNLGQAEMHKLMWDNAVRAFGEP